MRMVAVCLKPGQDLRQAIEATVAEHRISAGTILSCVGALRHARLRLADAETTEASVQGYEGPFEIISLNGNVGPGRTHLHLSIADSTGKVVGGHLKTGGNIVHITAELVIAVDDGLRFREEYDPSVGWDNLVIDELPDDQPK